MLEIVCANIRVKDPTQSGDSNSLMIRLNGQAWQHRGYADRDAVGKTWGCIDGLTWREAYDAIRHLAAVHLGETDCRHAVFRAFPVLPADHVGAIVSKADGLGRAFANYRWDFSGMSARVRVLEKGGMRGGATFEGIAPYPVPGYDLAWIDDSPGG